MYRFSKILKKHRPEIISDIYDDKFYTLIVQDWKYKKILRKDAPVAAPDAAWEGYYWHNSGSFKNIIDKNIPCVLMHKVKNNWCPEIDTVVCFMTGDTLDVFLVHPKDLMEWDPDDV